MARSGSAETTSPLVKRLNAYRITTPKSLESPNTTEAAYSDHQYPKDKRTGYSKSRFSFQSSNLSPRMKPSLSSEDNQKSKPRNRRFNRFDAQRKARRMSETSVTSACLAESILDSELLQKLADAFDVVSPGYLEKAALSDPDLIDIFDSNASRLMGPPIYEIPRRSSARLVPDARNDDQEDQSPPSLSGSAVGGIQDWLENVVDRDEAELAVSVSGKAASLPSTT
ncbi:hypothetical protein FQN57_000677 [Myotisia sp. PD_48]|nr:hypothetical protein FQN57_000677 [Myotisia sp. PD_48]